MTVALIPIMALYIYVLFLPYLIYRRKKDNARVSHSGKLIVESKKKKNYIVLSIAGVVLFAGLSFLGGGSNGSSSKIEGFIESEKKISEVLGRYNSEAGVAVGVVRGISDGTLSAGDGIGKFAVAGSKVTPILSELRNVCAGISFPEITGQGEELALAKAMNMLKVACDVTPQQFLVLQQIFQEQISDSGTQQRLDELSTQLQNLGQTKIDAAVEGIKAMLPYANEDEAKLLNAMLEGFANR
jgi:hypothetical protein